MAHDSFFGGHLGVKKTEDRIQINFFRPGLHEDVVAVALLILGRFVFCYVTIVFIRFC